MQRPIELALANDVMEAITHFLRETSIWILALCFVVENALILLASVVIGYWLNLLFASHRVTEKAPPLTGIEVGLATTTVLLNSLVTLVGLLLWKSDIIHFREEIGFVTLLDFLFLVLVMDVCMYVLHRIAHIPLFFKIVHRTHHKYDNPRPLTLFVMNPLEALSFGALWLVLLCFYPATWLGMSLYLAFNVAFGLLGHVGVEPFPASWQRTPIVRYLSTSSFHAGHHQDEEHNFGFYTLIWDKLFGTLAPAQQQEYVRASTPHS